MRGCSVWMLLALSLLVGGGVRAQEAGQLAGAWKRTKVSGQGQPNVYRLEAKEGGLQGELLNAQDGSCKVELTLSGAELKGSARWEDESSGEALAVAWELKVESPDRLTGRCEYKVWEFFDDGQAKVSESGWEDYVFERVRRVGLVSEGVAEEAPFGTPLEDQQQLVGGWVGPGGAWALTIVPGGEWMDLTPVGHQLAERIRLKDERGTLKGGATLPGGQGCEVELAFDEGALAGRSSWREEGLEGEGSQGWSPLRLERLPRIDQGEGAAPDAPAPGDEGSPGQVSVWRRDDGTYLRLREGPGGLEGDLVDRDGALKARVSLQARGGLWVGRANWDGAEANWELARQGDQLIGRCEWIDVHEGQVVARGWSARSFKKLRRVM